MLENFLDGIDPQIFFSDYWGTELLHFERAALSIEDPDNLLSTILSLKKIFYPQFRVLNKDGALSPLEYTESSRFGLSERIINSKLTALATAPNTIKIEDLASVAPEFQKWSEVAEKLFESRITLNGYFSFGPSGGIPSHYDPHHIFAIQLYGSKEWTLGLKQDEYYPHNAVTLTDSSPQTKHVKINLQAGGMLYVPPGRVHSVKTDYQSIHVALGIHTPRCFQSISNLLDRATKRHPELRSDMPFSVASEGLKFGQISKAELELIFTLLREENEL